MKISDYQLLAIVLHDLLHSYQEAVRETLGNSDASMVQFQDYLWGIKPLLGKDMTGIGFEQLISVLSEKCASLELANIVLEKNKAGGYLFRVENCVWAEFKHRYMNVKGVTCPWALMAMAIYQTATGKKVLVADSEYYSRGTATPIRAAGDLEEFLNAP